MDWWYTPADRIHLDKRKKRKKGEAKKTKDMKATQIVQNKLLRLLLDGSRIKDRRCVEDTLK